MNTMAKVWLGLCAGFILAGVLAWAAGLETLDETQPLDSAFIDTWPGIERETRAKVKTSFGVAHYPEGGLKTGVVDTVTIAEGAVTASRLSADVQARLLNGTNAVITALLTNALTYVNSLETDSAVIAVGNSDTTLATFTIESNSFRKVMVTAEVWVSMPADKNLSKLWLTVGGTEVKNWGAQKIGASLYGGSTTFSVQVPVSTLVAGGQTSATQVKLLARGTGNGPTAVVRNWRTWGIP